MSTRALKIKNPPMRGSDVKLWQQQILDIGKSWNVHFPLKVDGNYGMATRSFGKMVLYGRGYTYEDMEKGITPMLRSQMRHPERRSAAVKARANSAERKKFRDNLREKFEGDEDVAAPISRILTMAWGWHPPVHDGIDLICGPNAPIYAICDAKVIDVRSGGWWGKAPSGNTALGDGIIQLECTNSVGPFRKGMHIGYGHAEKAEVKEGDKVEAGTLIGRAGLAVAWHIHLMVNKGGTEKGIGTMDPRPFVDYALKHD